MHEIKCGEIWGGVHGADLDVNTCGVDASLFSSPCDGGKGGDIYYFSVCDSDLLTRIAIADVTGHGKAVSDTSEWLYNSLRDRMNNADSNVILSDLNTLAVEHGYKAITTAAIAAFYRKNNQLSFSYAGHHPVMIRRKGDNNWTSLNLPDKLKPANAPLGVLKDLPFEQSSIPLKNGDMIFLYTDGVVEAKSPSGELFGEARLLLALRSSDGGPKAIKNAVLKSVKQHVQGELTHDDVTFTAVRIHGGTL